MSNRYYEQEIGDKVMSVDACIASVERWRAHKKEIVFTNGCFDLLHRGHLRLLWAAKGATQSVSQRRILIVGLNSDTSVRALKGSSRPVLDERSRSEILASLIMVDAVVLFSTPTPEALIEALRPDILVKGGDYKESDIAGGQFIKKIGGNITIIPLLCNYSTTNMIRTLQD